MKKIFVALLLLLPTIVNAQSWEWVKRPYTPAIEAYLCATDKFGHVYGGGGNLVTQYDTSGTFQWIRSISGAFPIAITADNSGNLYELGAYTNSSVTVDSFVLTNTHNPYYQFFIVKYNTMGTVVWARNIGNVVSMGSASFFTSFNYYTGIATDLNNNIYITCPFSNNPTLGSYSFMNHDPSDSSNDVLIAKLDSSGSVLWAKSYGGKRNDIPAGIVITSTNNIYIDGNFSSDTLLLGSTTLTDTSTYLYKNSYFLAKLDSIGNPIWAKAKQGTCNSVGVTGIINDGYDNVYICGSFGTGSVIFGSTTFTSSVLYTNYGFLTKYDLNGNLVWAKETQSCAARSIAKDLCDNVWINGWMSKGTDTIDGHLISSPFHSLEPMFIAGWNPSGTFVGASGLNAGGDDQSQIAFDCAGSLFVCGDYNNDTFYVGHDTLYGGTGGGQEYMFIAKYNDGLSCNRCSSITEGEVQPVQTSILNIYPIPTTRELTINASYRIFAISVTNLIGQTLYNNHYNSSHVQIDVKDLPAGIYLIRINGTEIRKFVKQ